MIIVNISIQIEEDIITIKRTQTNNSRVWLKPKTKKIRNNAALEQAGILAGESFSAVVRETSYWANQADIWSA